MLPLTVRDARLLLDSRSDLVDRGGSDRELAARLASGEIRRVRRGWYVRTADWEAQWNEGRHLMQVVATHQNSDAPGPLFVGASAAVLHGLPLYAHSPTRAHAVVEHRGHTSRRQDIHWHNVRLAESDEVVVDGIRCTSLSRTVLDLAAGMRFEGAVAVADAALRAFAVPDGRHQDPERAEAWREELRHRASRVSTRGIRQARRVIEFADGRAQLPGESVSRVRLDQLGFTRFELQSPVTAPDGQTLWMDFAFPRARCFGEFDGRTKYSTPEYARGRTPMEVLIDEKSREDAVRGVTGWRIARWGFEHIRTPDALGARLHAFGITPP